MPDRLAQLARDVAAIESLRAVKDLQRTYAHYRQFGLEDDIAKLFTTDASITIDGAPGGLPPAPAFVTEFIDEPLVTLLPGDDRARGRWMSLTFEGDGDGTARIRGGVYENDYRREDGVWRISGHHYFRQFEGDYTEGWTNVDGADLPVIPYHFTADDAGAPIPAAVIQDGEASPDPASSEELAARVGRLNDEDAVRNLVHAYGYYVDRRMWDDVVDLFVPDGAMHIGARRAFGVDGIRDALEMMGPAGLRTGDLNDRPLFDTIVRVAPDGSEAVTRSIELGMLAHAGEGGWEINVLRTRCVRDGSLFRIAEVHVHPLMQATYEGGWGDARTPSGQVPPFIGETASTEASGTPRPIEADLATVRRRLARSFAYDATENVSSAYGYYIDDFRWHDMADLHAEASNKQSPFAGYYLGKERIRRAVTELWGAPPDTRPGISYHWRIQPVIHVSADGRSAHLRTRLFQPRTHKEHLPAGEFYAAGFHSGMYPNDQTVLEADGVWRLWSLTIDEPYFTSPTWRGGWAAVRPRDDAAPPPRPNPLLERFPPDILLTDLGRREEHFRGGTGKVIEWPGILPMWFHYRNPVSGRVPEHYWPDCVPSEVRPETRLSAHGYQHPPNGPEVDGVELDA